jgi:hypothetical protein
MLGGAFEIVSQPMHGTQITVSVRLSALALPRDERLICNELHTKGAVCVDFRFRSLPGSSPERILRMSGLSKKWGPSELLRHEKNGSSKKLLDSKANSKCDATIS